MITQSISRCDGGLNSCLNPSETAGRIKKLAYGLSEELVLLTCLIRGCLNGQSLSRQLLSSLLAKHLKDVNEESKIEGTGSIVG